MTRRKLSLAWYLVAHLGRHLGLGGGLADDPGLGDVARQRLLAIDVLAQLQGRQRGEGVRMLGGAHDHGVEAVGVVEDPAEVAERRAFGCSFAPRDRRLLRDVAEHHDVLIGELLESCGRPDRLNRSSRCSASRSGSARERSPASRTARPPSPRRSARTSGELVWRPTRESLGSWVRLPISLGVLPTKERRHSLGPSQHRRARPLMQDPGAPVIPIQLLREGFSRFRGQELGDYG